MTDLKKQQGEWDNEAARAAIHRLRNRDLVRMAGRGELALCALLIVLAPVVAIACAVLP